MYLKSWHQWIPCLAQRQTLFDPDNAAAEFKLNMGLNKKYLFKDSGRELLPEELSAEVLKDLKNSVQKQVGIAVNSAVITVPADFGPLQNKATKKAAELAGFKFTPFIMEPVAAAYAYSNISDENGTWLVYDLGGGTFDVSIVKLDTIIVPFILRYTNLPVNVTLSHGDNSTICSLKCSPIPSSLILSLLVKGNL